MPSSSLYRYGSGIASGALAGTSVLPGVGTAIGAGIGFLSSLFGTSDSDIQKEHQDEANRLAAQEQAERQSNAAILSNISNREGVQALGVGANNTERLLRQESGSVNQGRGSGNNEALINNVENTTNLLGKIDTGFQSGLLSSDEEARNRYEGAIANVLNPTQIRAEQTQNDVQVGNILQGAGSAFTDIKKNLTEGGKAGTLGFGGSSGGGSNAAIPPTIPAGTLDNPYTPQAMSGGDRMSMTDLLGGTQSTQRPVSLDTSHPANKPVFDQYSQGRNQGFSHQDMVNSLNIPPSLGHIMNIDHQFNKWYMPENMEMQ